MKLHLIKLNQQGFDHVVGLASFVAIFAVVGVGLLVASHAATPTYVILRTASYSTSNACIGGASLTNCSSSNNNDLFLDITGSNFKIENKSSQCLENPNGEVQSKTLAQGGKRYPVVVGSCSSGNITWSWAGSGNHELRNNATGGCLNAAANGTTAGTPVIVYSCTGSSSGNETWWKSTDTTVTTSSVSSWSLTGTTAETNASGASDIVFSSTIKNSGPDTSGSFQYGPRYFYSSTASPTRGSNGAYAGEVETAADKTESSLKSGSSKSGITQTINIPLNEKSAYLCATVAFSPYNSGGSTNGRSKAVCISVAQQLAPGPGGK